MAFDRTAGDFGSKLRAALERRGLSLRQIAVATKISVSALDALERNDISRLPGGIFSRAFVRSYPVEVGLDPDATIQEFLAQFPGDTTSAGRPAPDQGEDTEAVESEQRMASTFLRLIAVSIPVAILVMYFGTRGRHSTPPSPHPEAAVGTMAPATSPPVSDPAPAPRRVSPAPTPAKPSSADPAPARAPSPVPPRAAVAPVEQSRSGAGAP